MGQPIYLLKQMPYTELVDWVAYSRIEPFGERRADWRTALSAAMTIEAAQGIMRMLAGKKGKRSKPVKIADFLLKFEGAKPRQSWQSQLQFVEHLNAMFGGKDLRPRPDPTEEN